MAGREVLWWSPPRPPVLSSQCPRLDLELYLQLQHRTTCIYILGVFSLRSFPAEDRLGGISLGAARFPDRGKVGVKSEHSFAPLWPVLSLGDTAQGQPDWREMREQNVGQDDLRGLRGPVQHRPG